MVSAASFSANLAHAEDFDDPVANLVYAECKNHEWYSQGKTDAHWKLLSASWIPNG